MGQVAGAGGEVRHVAGHVRNVVCRHVAGKEVYCVPEELEVCNGEGRRRREGTLAGK
jgi:hypothetical protein